MADDREYDNQLRIWETRTSEHIATANAAVSLAIFAIKSLLLVNGAAAIAVLTFYGNIIDVADLVRCWSNSAKFGDALKYFIWGIGGALGASLVGYFTQLSYLPDELKKWQRGLSPFLWGASIILAIASLSLFLCGAFAAADGLRL